MAPADRYGGNAHRNVRARNDRDPGRSTEARRLRFPGLARVAPRPAAHPAPATGPDPRLGLPRGPDRLRLGPGLDARGPIAVRVTRRGESGAHRPVGGLA